MSSSAPAPPWPATRGELLTTLTGMLEAGGQPWAWQGASGAPQRWAADHGPADLDVWCAAGPPSDALTRQYAGAVVAHADDARRLRHISLAVPVSPGLAVIDFTVGDLRVGPVLLTPAAEVTVDPETHRLTGAAAVADLLVRPVLRGRLPDPERLAEARTAWDEAEPAARGELARRLTRQLGARVAADLVAAAGGAAPDPGLPGRARRRLAVRSLAPAVIGATWAQRRSVLPAGPQAGPLGLRARGVVVALVGTDGSGKSTVAEALRERLGDCGFTTRPAYFGMARGNLPGVSLARRLLKVGGTAPASGDRPAGPGPLDRPWLRRAAAYLYAGEYGWRYLRAVTPARLRGEVVVADRWIYDLRESPWPGSRASRLAEFLLPAPDVLVLPDAPVDLIHRRKPERLLDEQREQQERYRRLLAERPARHAEVVVRTYGPPNGDLATLVAAIVAAAHGSHGSKR